MATIDADLSVPLRPRRRARQAQRDGKSVTSACTRTSGWPTSWRADSAIAARRTTIWSRWHRWPWCGRPSASIPTEASCSAPSPRPASSASSNGTSGTGAGPCAPRGASRSWSSRSAAPSDRLGQQLGRAPTVPELANEIGASEADVLEALEAGQSYRTSSLDARDREGQTMGDSLGSEDSGFVGVENHSALTKAMGTLSPRDRDDRAAALRRWPDASPRSPPGSVSARCRSAGCWPPACGGSARTSTRARVRRASARAKRRAAEPRSHGATETVSG